ncbi:extracellular solute-binding protein [Hyphomicrobiales bacterium]|jgi:peptide/nickel transport system substrate-binding protein|nr:extracellular solute-binding protein [Hyphomicrobiales bacterium]
MKSIYSKKYSHTRKKLIIFLILVLLYPNTALSEPSYGISMIGELGLKENFEHLPYSDPMAKKGGQLKLSTLGTYDSTNPFIIRGRSAYGIKDYVFETLLTRNYDEPFSLYGLIAESIETPADRSWVEYKIRNEAKFSNGVDITANDVMYSYDLLKENGRPNHRAYYSKVKKVDIVDNKTIRFYFNDISDRELPLILSLMPILPQHIYSKQDFTKTTLAIPIGSGPYVVDNLNQGKNITYKLNTNYWGKNLGINKGLYNFKIISVDYYLDENSRYEAFKSGLSDLYQIWDPARWINASNIKNVKNGKILLKEINKNTPAGMLGMAFNTRREIFMDNNIRRALINLFDFNWLNKNLYYGLYNRTNGYYDNSYLSSIGNPINNNERRLLKSFVIEINDAVKDGTFVLTKTNKNNDKNRERFLQSLKMFKDSGYNIENGIMVNYKTKEPFSFEILINSKRQERYLLSFIKTLESIGITAKLRLVDSTQYQKRKQTFDFDMIEHFWYASLSPGNEQKFYWGSQAATEEGSRNYPGINSKAIDHIISNIISSEKSDDFVDSVRSLDRLLISGNYVLPLFNWPTQWVAHNINITHPEKHSLDGYKIHTWHIAN